MIRMTGMTQPGQLGQPLGRPLAFEADLLRLQLLDELGIVDLDGDEVLGDVVRVLVRAANLLGADHDRG